MSVGSVSIYPPSEHSIPKALYHENQDNRLNLYEENVPEHIPQQANSVACLIHEVSQIYLRKKHDVYTFQNTPKLSKTHGPSVNFNDEIIPGFGTAFLVGDGLALTAGHCIFKEKSFEICADRVNTMMLVFGFHLSSPGVVAPINESRVCKIKRVVTAAKNAQEGDWALLKLDKHPEGAVPLSINFSSLVAKTTSIYMLGHPSGLPMKYTHSGVIVNESRSPTHFGAALDAFQGNSGSPVFDEITQDVIGMLTNGQEDYIKINGKICEYRAKASQHHNEACQKMTALPESVIKMIHEGVPEKSLQQYVKENINVTDVELATFVKDFIPENTYTSVAVQTSMHTFLDTEVQTRIFTFSPSGNSLSDFFLGIQRFLFGFSTANSTPYSTNGMARYLLGLPDFENGKKEIERAFDEKRAIYLFLSQDGNMFEVRVEQNQKGIVGCSIS